ncbi:hypothetical protein IscW_ISCW000748 [Ixodes scapularis]|uniref:Uncharacterized protein n=1 Tax=Ixodes scapularis TaxID=6945 RepID=B7P102_IXOSC|nr:hypothetical protein IscW_ISCW000748 [Ixodes scapularis]|eukprot:XP_002399764.1 hypothetical protein IscW_ISCW000748 [Ixodes scapularis]
MSPCTCDYSGINCMKAKTTESLQKAFGVGGPGEHRGLWIQRTPVPSLPVGVFGKFKFVKAYIDLNKNLTSFSLEALANSKDTLEELSLFSNDLSRIDYDRTRIIALASLNPTDIQIDLGRIESIHPKAFEKTFPLELTLSYNDLTSFPKDVFHPIIIGALQNVQKGLVSILPKVLTRGNRFTCRGCDYKWLLPFASNTAMQRVFSDFSCEDGTRLYNLTSSVIGC